MKIIKILSLLIILSAHFLFAQSETDNEKGLIYLRSNLEVLASDLFEGRETATRGANLAALFISSELTKYGVKPFGDKDSYFQVFNLSSTKVEPETELTIFNIDGTIDTLMLGEDFILSKERLPSENYSSEEKGIVFAGYGITADDYDDYKEIDVKGKVVLIQPGLPEMSDNRFSETDEKKFGDRSYKYKNAKEHGAAGVLVVPAGMMLKYWGFMKKRALSSSVSLIDNDEKSEDAIPVVYLSEEAAKKLLLNEQYTYDELIEISENKKMLPVFDLTKKAKLHYKVSSEIKEAKNVLGIIEGKDEEFKNEYVVLSAHYDHVGVRDEEVYNGADDDGSGTVAILEAARRLAALNNNKRSIIFAFHTGEEKGLLGSKYLTGNSDFIKDIIANINIDMVGREDTESIYSIGSDRLSSELKELVENANTETVKFELDYTFDDPKDPNRYFYRSDHYSYAKQNIPIVFFYDHMTEDYHKASDEVDKINFEKIERVSTLITELALRIANLEHKLILDKKEEESVETE
jgi:Peptidase family M28/PA domain